MLAFYLFWVYFLNEFILDKVVIIELVLVFKIIFKLLSVDFNIILPATDLLVKSLLFTTTANSNSLLNFSILILIEELVIKFLSIKEVNIIPLIRENALILIDRLFIIVKFL